MQDQQVSNMTMLQTELFMDVTWNEMKLYTTSQAVQKSNRNTHVDTNIYKFTLL